MHSYCVRVANRVDATMMIAVQTPPHMTALQCQKKCANVNKRKSAEQLMLQIDRCVSPHLRDSLIRHHAERIDVV